MITLESLRGYLAKRAGVPLEEVDAYRHIDPVTGKPTDTVTAQVHSNRLRTPGSLWHELTVTPVAQDQTPQE